MQPPKLSKWSVTAIACMLMCIQALHAQTPAADTSLAAKGGMFQPYNNANAKAVKFINKKYGDITDAVDKKTEKMLSRMQRKEAKLQQKLQKIDSNKAQQLFANSQAQYQQLQTRLQSPVTSASGKLQQYIPNIDSVQTALSFLSQNNGSIPGITPDKLAQIQAASAQVSQLEGRLQQANDAQQFVRDREAYLKQQLQNTPLAKAVTGLNQEVYYYQQQLNSYKELLNDPEKLGEKLLTVASTMPAFRNFFARNSYLSQLFQMPGTSAPAAAQAGLQTRAGVQGILSQQLGGSIDPQQFVQQQAGAPQSPIADLKNKLSQMGSGSAGSSDVTMPDFKPNTQHNKTFFKRLQWGFNFQSLPATSLVPATTDMALTVGYKISDTKTVGIGASYNLGLGNGFNSIQLTSQGVGMRSFADIKLKGSIWLTGGFEYTYYQAFAKLSDIYNLDVWQKSALLGLSKKYSIGKNREGDIQVLYDFLATREFPRGQPLKFRLGYSF